MDMYTYAYTQICVHIYMYIYMHICVYIGDANDKFQLRLSNSAHDAHICFPHTCTFTCTFFFPIRTRTQKSFKPEFKFVDPSCVPHTIRIRMLDAGDV